MKLNRDKSSLIDTEIYVKVYFNSLSSFLSVEDRQTVFMISKFFTDSATEVEASQFALADYYFSLGEMYSERVQDVLMKEIIANIYGRSKSFYFFKIDKVETAIQLIKKTIEINKSLELKGFTFLVFDRASQYYNLAKVYFFLENRKVALKLLSEITCFLIKGQANSLTDLNDSHVSEYNEDLSKMRHGMMCQVIFETVGHLQRESLDFISESTIYFEDIFNIINSLKVRLQEDLIVKKWLMCVSKFYLGKGEGFAFEATHFIDEESSFYNSLPKEYLLYYLNLQSLGFSSVSNSSIAQRLGQTKKPPKKGAQIPNTQAIRT